MVKLRFWCLPMAGLLFSSLFVVRDAAADSDSSGDTVFIGDSVKTPTQLSQDSLLQAASAQTIAAANINKGGQVTPTGAFTYSIPIELPSSVHGLIPSLALTYDSQGKDGMVGLGWSLTGLPAIVRANSGDGISYGGGVDTYAVVSSWGGALDPRGRLVPLPTTATGAEKGAYHTLEESWANYVPQGSCGSGPCSWAMQDGHGLTYIFGDADQSGGHKVWEPNTGPTNRRGVFGWLLAKVVDRYGNYYTIHWGPLENTTPSIWDYYPLQIAYTLNDAVPGAAVSARLIKFRYEPRHDTTRLPYYFRKRLSNIEIDGPQGLVHTYQLSYRPDDYVTAYVNRHSRLQSVQELGSDGNPFTGLPPYTFNYSADPAIRTASASSATQMTFSLQGYAEHTPTIDHPPFLMGDVNGDGKADLVMAELSRKGVYIYVAYGAANGLAPLVVNTSIANPPDPNFDVDKSTAMLLDLNGDGFQDLVVIGIDKSQTSVGIAYGSKNGLGPFASAYSLNSKTLLNWDKCQKPLDVVPLDINGDQETELAFVCYAKSINETDVVIEGLKSGYFQPIQQIQDTEITWDLSDSNLRIRSIAGDFDGNGKSDLLISYAHKDPNSIDTINNTNSASPDQPVGYMKLYRSVGAALGPPEYGQVPPQQCLSCGLLVSWVGDYPVAGDFNGDGTTDLIYPSGVVLAGVSGGGQTPVAGDYTTYTLQFSDVNGNSPAFSALDLNNDGADDLLSPWASAGMSGQPNMLLTNVAGLSMFSPDYDFSLPFFVYHNLLHKSIPGDFDGDGIPEAMFFGGNRLDWPNRASEFHSINDYRGDYIDAEALQIFVIFDNTAALAPTAIGSTSSAGFGDNMPAINCPHDGTYGSDSNSTQYADCDYFQLLSGDVNGDGLDDIVVASGQAKTGTGFYALAFKPDTLPDLITQVNNGFGGLTTVTYREASAMDGNQALVESGNPVSGSNRNLSHRPLVSTMQTYDGRALKRNENYLYKAGAYTRGAGPLDEVDLGFASIQKVDVEAGFTDTTTFFQTSDLKRLPSTHVVTSANGAPLISESYTYVRVPANQNIAASSNPVASTSYVVNTNYHRDEYKAGGLSRTVVAHYGYDNFGNLSSHSECDSAPSTATACSYQYNYFTNDLTAWNLGRKDWAETYDAPAGSGSQHVLSKRQYSYAANGYDLTDVSALACNDTDMCYCIPGPTSNCSSPSGVGWTQVQSGIQYDAMGNVASYSDAVATVSMQYGVYTNKPTSVDRNWYQHVARVIRRYDDIHTYVFDSLGRLSTSSYGPTYSANYYDNNGRLYRTDQSDGGSDYYLFPNWGNPDETSGAAQAVVHVRAATSAGLPMGDGRAFGQWNAQYFDGFGNVFQEQRNGDNGVVVENHRREWYDTSYSHHIVYGRPRSLSTGIAPDEFEVDYGADGTPSSIRKLAYGNIERELESYEFNGNQTVIGDANGHSISYLFDGRNLAVRRVDGVAAIGLHYDATGNLRQIDKADGATHTLIGFDSLGRRRALSDPEIGSLTYAYDDNGNMLTRTDTVRNMTTTYTYDGLNRVVTRVAADENVTYSWQECGISTVFDGSGNTSFTYDNACNVSTKTASIDGYPQTVSATLVHDYLGRLTSKTMADGSQLTYTYWDGANLSGNLYQVLWGGNALATYSNYDPSGRAWTRQTSAGTTTTLTYNGLEFLTSIKSVSAAGSTLQDETITPDYLGNIMSIADNRSNTLVGSIDTSVTQGFTYDPVDRLVTATGVYGALAFNYDPNGNITQKGDVGITYPANQIVGTRGLAVVFSGTYDGAGHLVSKTDDTGKMWSNVFDSNGRLAEVSANNVLVANFSYDHSGARRRKSFHTTNNETVDTYYFEGWEARISSTQPSSQSTTVDLDGPGVGSIATITTGPISGQPAQSSVDAAESSPWSGDTSHGPAVGEYFYLKDHLGSSVVMTDAAGVELSRTVHLPYGEIDRSHSTGLDIVTHKFTGNELDAESGLVFFGARYYDPIQGRFVSADSVVASSLDSSQSLARYAYVLNNPLKYRDPTGHVPILAAAAAWAIGGAILGAGTEALAEYLSGQPFNGTRIGAAAVGGGVTAGLAVLSMGTSLASQIVGLGAASVEGSIARSAINGQSYGASQAATDFSTGAAVATGFQLAATGVSQTVSAIYRASSSTVAVSSVEGPVVEAVGSNGYSATWPGDAQAGINFETTGNYVEVTDIARGSQPPGSAGTMLAKSLQEAGIPQPSNIRVSSIQNAPTLGSLQAGAAPSETVLGKTLSNTASALGGTVAGWEGGLSGGEGWLEINITYP